MTNLELTKTRQEQYNLTDDEFNHLRTTYIQNLQMLSDGFLRIKNKIENGEYTSEEDWEPLFLILTQKFQYADKDGFDGEIELDRLFDQEIHK